MRLNYKTLTNLILDMIYKIFNPNRKYKRSLFIVVTLSIVLLTIIYNLIFSDTDINGFNLVKGNLFPPKGYYKVARVVDGDTFIANIDGKEEKIRLLGVDTPESVDPRKEVECFGVEASNHLKQLLENTNVRMEAEDSQGNADKYGRLLRYVFLEDKTFVNREIIQQGYGFEYTYDLPYKYQKEFKDYEEDAEKNKRGLWGSEECQSLYD